MRHHVTVLALLLIAGCVRPGVVPQATTVSGVFDPKSKAAAADVVQQYAAAIERRDFATAANHWGDRAQASAFEAELKRYGQVHLWVGIPGEVEGAAGSSYVTVPVIVTGKDPRGADVRRSASVILRRVNDVDGSSAAQRRWHIERIEWKLPA